MTADGTNSNLFSSNADWISPCYVGADDYFANPPAADGSKVIIPDTDHISSQTYDVAWVWRSFLRGLNPIVMDWWNGTQWDPIQRAMRDIICATINISYPKIFNLFVS